MSSSTARSEELKANLADVRGRIAAACEQAGRSAGEVTLIAITKTFPVSDIRLLAELGVLDIGENRDQEAAPKAAECAGFEPPLRWHFVGQLQANKAKSVARYADVIHSVDRSRLVHALGARARAAGRTVTCLVQVDLDEAAAASPENGEPGAVVQRGGAAPNEVPALAEAIAGEEGLTLGGVMAVAPLGAPPRPAFSRLAGVAAIVRKAHPGATMISAGMTGDLEEAIAEGATHVRVGTALLGGRAALVR
ncbi:MAG: YggS family pyridoxal phosphate-dependent enzyme [Nocardiopsaceae bacterium]|jgi:pyridoxal phosphate enzyme (YggS family)|nr:YggS family pyridoxal phosphate-dependent enzyme [Nocardiopsaceae bacterium]